MPTSTSSPRTEPIRIHASNTKKLGLLLGVIVSFLLGGFLLFVTPLHPSIIRYLLYRSTGILLLILIIGSLPRIWEILTKPILIINEKGVRLSRITIPWEDIRDVRCDNEGQWIYLTVLPAEKYRRLNRWHKRLGFQQQDEVVLNFGAAAKSDYLTVCRILHHQLKKASSYA